MENEDVAFDEWAKVELFGHQVLIARVTKAPIGDFIQCDIPKPDGTTLCTKLVNPKAVYAISPISRELALKLAANYQTAPVTRYELPEPKASPAIVPENGTDGNDDEDEDDHADFLPRNLSSSP